MKVLQQNLKARGETTIPSIQQTDKAKAPLSPMG
jgi:hypothetical protein